MALRITIDGTAETTQIPFESISIVETVEAGGPVSTASFDAIDNGASEAFDAKMAVVIDDDGGSITYFKGEIAGAPERKEVAPSKVIWHVECQDYNQLLAETVVTSYSAAAGTLSDAAIIDAMVSAARGEADIDSTTDVAQIFAAGAMPDYAVTACSLSEALAQLCEITGGRFYVDFSKNLHYYAASPDTNADSLTDGGGNYRYWGMHRLGDVGIVNAVYIEGKEIAGWRTDATSVSNYGSREMAVRDQSIVDATGLNAAGDAILAANKDPAETYELWTDHSGYRAGENVAVTSSAYGLSAESLLILKVETVFNRGDLPRYLLTVGDDVLNAPMSASNTAGRIAATEIRINELDTLASHGWSHDLVFSATDNDTVAWAAGNIYLAGGVGTFAINGNNTGNISAVTYIYFDADASTTELQTDTDASNTVGANKILIGVCEDVAAGKNAVYYVFGGAGNTSLITADNITAATITADELAANCITAGKLTASLTLTTELVAGSVVIDSNGILLPSHNGTAYSAPKSMMIQNGATAYGHLGSFYYSPGGGDADYHILELEAEAIAAKETHLHLVAGKTSSYETCIKMSVPTLEFALKNDSSDAQYAALSGSGDIILFLDDTANANMTVGITIDQGANDDQILSFQSSDVGHGETGIAETDTYGFFRKVEGASGGLEINGMKDSDGVNSRALNLVGWLDEDVDTTKNSGGKAIVMAWGYQTSGGVANTVADGNVFAVGTYRGGSSVTVMIVDEDGDIYYDGAAPQNYDDYDDALMAGDLARVMSGNYEQLIAHNREAFEAAGIIGPTDEQGRFMISTKRLAALTLGALGQLWDKCQRYERALLAMGADRALLEGT